jgi:hypothetical protein
MPDIYSPNIVGPLALAGSPGAAGQVLVSAGPGLQPVWSDSVAGNLSGSQISAFGRIRTAEPAFLISHTGGYDLAPLIWETMTSGAGNTATWNSTTRGIDLVVASAGYVVRQTRQYVAYQPGRGQLIMMTSILGAPVANVTRRVGQFDAQNGLFFQEQAGVKSIVVRNNFVDTVVPQSSWNIDKFDGTGASGKTLDLSKDQVFVIDYAWLGTSQVRWGFMSNGEIAYCHKIDFANTQANSYMQTAFLPLRYELVASAAAVSTITQICSTIATEAGIYSPPGGQFTVGRVISAALAVGTEGPVIAIRPVTTFGVLPNRIHIQVSNLEVYASGGPTTWRLLYYPPGSANPVTGGTFAQPNANSAVEANSSGTALSLTGAIELNSGFVAASAGASHSEQASNIIAENVAQSYPIVLDATGGGSPLVTNVGGNPAYIVISAVGASASAAAKITWIEIR